MSMELCRECWLVAPYVYRYVYTFQDVYIGAHRYTPECRVYVHVHIFLCMIYVYIHVLLSRYRIFHLHIHICTCCSCILYIVSDG